MSAPAVLVYLLAVSSSAAVRTARDFNLWQKCWRVYRTAMIMLGAIDLGTLDAYERHVKDLHDLYKSDCWHVIYRRYYRRVRLGHVVIDASRDSGLWRLLLRVVKRRLETPCLNMFRQTRFD